jgi:hypothetical protein
MGSICTSSLGMPERHNRLRVGMRMFQSDNCANLRSNHPAAPEMPENPMSGSALTSVLETRPNGGTNTTSTSQKWLLNA